MASSFLTGGGYQTYDPHCTVGIVIRYLPGRTSVCPSFSASQEIPSPHALAHVPAAAASVGEAKAPSLRNTLALAAEDVLATGAQVLCQTVQPAASGEVKRGSKVSTGEMQGWSKG